MESEVKTGPVRVAIVDNALAFGGTLTVIRNLVKHLSPDAVRISVITACPDPFIDPADLSHVTVHICRPYANYQRTDRWYKAIHKLTLPGRARRLLEQSLVALGLIANLAYSLRLSALLLKDRAQVVHFNQGAPDMLWVSKILRVPAVLHLHGLLPVPLPRSMKSALDHVRAFVAISTCVHDAARAAGVAESRLHRIPNFVSDLPAQAPCPLPDSAVVGIFGRVIPWKGQKEFIAAFQIVAGKFPDARALIVGDAADGDRSYMEECVAAVERLGLSGKVTFAGMVSDVATYYRQCSVVVHASISPEPFGMVIIEAMAEGRPLVVSALGAGADIVLDGGAGLVADPRDSGALAEKICVLLANRDLAKKLGQRGFEEVQRRYDPRVAARSFQNLYRSLASSPDT